MSIGRYFVALPGLAFHRRAPESAMRRMVSSDSPCAVIADAWGGVNPGPIHSPELSQETTEPLIAVSLAGGNVVIEMRPTRGSGVHPRCSRVAYEQRLSGSTSVVNDYFSSSVAFQHSLLRGIPPKNNSTADLLFVSPKCTLRCMEVMMSKIKIPQFVCLRCGHTWFPRKAEIPSRCGKCKSPYWQKPKAER